MKDKPEVFPTPWCIISGLLYFQGHILLEKRIQLPHCSTNIFLLKKKSRLGFSRASCVNCSFTEIYWKLKPAISQVKYLVTLSVCVFSSMQTTSFASRVRNPKVWPSSSGVYIGSKDCVIQIPLTTVKT